MSFLDLDNKVDFGRTLREDGFSIFDYNSVNMDVRLGGIGVILEFDEETELDWYTVLSKKEVKDLIDCLTVLHDNL